MNIYDKTADLANSIRESREFSEYMETKAEIDSTPKAREILKEYRARQFALQLAEMSGEGVEAVNESLEEICGIMEQDTLLNRFLDAEYNLFNMMTKIRDIFAGQLNFPEVISGENSEDDEDGPVYAGAEYMSGGFLN